MIRVLIVDDEPLARSRIKKLLDSNMGIEIVGECRDGAAAVEMANDLRPELIFLDIQMKNFNGFQALDKIDYEPTVIFITAYDKYALKAFEYFAFDYLLKPFKDGRFYTSLDKAIESINTQRDLEKISQIRPMLELISSESREDLSKINLDIKEGNIPIRLGDKIYFIKKREIEYISASSYYAEIMVKGKKHVLRESLTNLIQKLDPNSFSRIHRSTIINKEFVKELVSIGYGDYELNMIDGSKLRISKNYKDDVIRMLGVRD